MAVSRAQNRIHSETTKARTRCGNGHGRSVGVSGGGAVLQATYCVVVGAYNQFLARLLFVYMLSLLALFAQFYVQKYSRTGARRANGHNGTARNGNAVDGVTNGNGALAHERSNGKSKAV